MAKPAYRVYGDSTDSALGMTPPFNFDGVTTRVFPLKANMARLRAFCSDYLNIMPPSIAEFQPALPYVYLMVLDYGKMSIEAANMGWISQREVAFAVPLEWYKTIGGKRIFQDWAYVTPFIFVDNEMSLTTGREVYGWPKVSSEFDPEVNPWLEHPRNLRSMMHMSSMIFPDLYSGKRQQDRLLLEIDKAAPPSFSQLPPNLYNPFNPLLSIPKGILSAWSLFGNALDIAASLPIRGYSSLRNPRNLPAMLRKGIGYINLARPINPFNIITLKQFRDAEKPDYVSYQEILNSQMSIHSYNAGGMLGDVDMLRGDYSGGFSIKIHRYTAQPIIESFGLEVASEFEVEDEQAQEAMGKSVATVKPVFPFWMELDLGYGLGQTIGWRTRDSAWHLGGSTKPVAEPSTTRGPNLFNTSRGAALQAIAGPFEFPNVTLRVMPLMADAQKLARLCQQYLQTDKMSFEPFGSYVYLMAVNIDEMSSQTNNIGLWADRELDFVIPIKCYEGHGEDKKLVGLALFAPFVYVDSSTAAITGREVNGRPSYFAKLESPGDVWMEEAGPKRERELLNMKTDVFPSLRMGQKAEERLLLEIRQGHVHKRSNGADNLQAMLDHWGPKLRQDHHRKIQTKQKHGKEFKDLKAALLDLMIRNRPFSGITLRQIRDAEQPDNACFQALVLSRRSLTRVFEIQEIEELMHVGIHRYPSHPIVNTLGLQTKISLKDEDSIVDIMQPVRPFWARLSVKEELGKNLCWRAGSEQWCWCGHRFYFQADEQPLCAGHDQVDAIETQGKRIQELAAVKPKKPVTKAEVQAALEKIEPQTIIESILSREWQGGSHSRRAKGEEQKPDFCIRTDSLGSENTDWFQQGRVMGKGLWYSEEDSSSVDS